MIMFSKTRCGCSWNLVRPQLRLLGTCTTRNLHTSSVLTSQTKSQDHFAGLFESKKQNRRKVYQRLKSVVRKELESSFKLHNRTKLGLLDKKSRNLRIKYNPKEEGEFSDFGIHKWLAKSLSEGLPHVHKPTGDQRKILSVLNSRLSCLARCLPGTGKSLALVLYALNYRRPDPLHTTGLIIVPTTELVKQYADICSKLLQKFPGDTRKMVQFTYRGSEEIEGQQEKDLEQFIPHTLVTTPQRLLDLISDHPENPDHYKLSKVKFILCDESDFLLVGEEKLNNRKEVQHTKPTEILIDYINKVRSTVVNNPPLQYCFINSTDLSNKISELVSTKDWCRDRPIVNVGLPVIRNNEVVPRLRIPRDVNVSAVVALGPDQLLDVKLNELPVGVEAMSKIKSSTAVEFDLNYKNYRNQKTAKSGTDQRVPQEVISAIPNYLAKTGSENTRQLMIIPEGVSTNALITRLKEVGIYAASSSELDRDVTSNNFFLKKDPEPNTDEKFSPTHPQFLISSVRLIIGRSFPGLEKILCLGVDSVMDAASLISVVGRCRSSQTGLVEESNFSTYFVEREQYSLEALESRCSQVTLLYLLSQFKLMERFALERMVLKTGLPHLEPLVEDYEQVDLTEYEKLFNDFD